MDTGYRKYAALLLLGALPIFCIASGWSKTPALIGRSSPGRISGGNCQFCYRIAVPRRYTWGGNPRWGKSAIDYYVEAYELGWWACLDDYAKNISYSPSAAQREGMGGWPAQVDGYPAGYTAAEKRIHMLIQRFGKGATEVALKRWVNPAG